jgi:hypothetical protein
MSNTSDTVLCCPKCKGSRFEMNMTFAGRVRMNFDNKEKPVEDMSAQLAWSDNEDVVCADCSWEGKAGDASTFSPIASIEMAVQYISTLPVSKSSGDTERRVRVIKSLKRAAIEVAEATKIAAAVAGIKGGAGAEEPKAEPSESDA